MTTDDPRAKTGGIWPAGLPTGQSWLDLGALLHLCDKYEIKSFIEIGVLEGGLAAFLFGRVRFSEKFRYLGIEVESRFLSSGLQQGFNIYRGFDLFIGDAFDEPMIVAVSHWIGAGSGRVLLYCDDGDKPREFAAYSSILRTEDLIAAHDVGFEFKAEDLKIERPMERIDSDWLKDTRLIAFRVIG
jgi:hypothetical protein